jgi:hypothetical protein
VNATGKVIEEITVCEAAFDFAAFSRVMINVSPE